MQESEQRLALPYVGHRAYELARSGRYADFASIEQAIIDEGYDETVPWLERPGVIEALDQICFVSRELVVRAAADCRQET
ncbi:MAG TPA: hypothetical protein VII20_18745 [Roseiarcus sp.]|jgi:hypothetical protein